MTKVKEAIKKVTYDKFYFREENFESYSVYVPSSQAIDTMMIDDIAFEFDKLDEELQNNFYVVKAAFDSYRKIIEHLRKVDPVVVYTDNTMITYDTQAMIEIIENEYLGDLEEKCYDLFSQLVENILKDKLIDEFRIGVEDIKENISMAFSDEDVDFSDIALIDIDKYFGRFVKNIFEDEKYRIDIDIYVDNIQAYCEYKGYSLEELDTLISKVILHELAHYYMFPAKIGDEFETIKYANEPFHTLYYKDNCWYKTIEESLCNYLAYTQNWSDEQKEFIASFISEQSDDYRYALNIQKIQKSALSLAKKWKTLKINVKKPDGDYEFVDKDKIFSLKEFANRLKKDELSKDDDILDVDCMLSVDDGVSFFEIKGDSIFIPQEVKDIFIF